MKFSIVYMMSEEDALREKKLRGSGGFVYAKVTDYVALEDLFMRK
jgi:hypothetical protein